MSNTRRVAAPLALALCLLSGFGFTLHNARAASQALGILSAEAPASLAETVPITGTVYLPTVINRRSPEAKVGADFGHMTAYADVVATDYPTVQQFGGDWIRIWLPWAEIETSPGEYDWSAYDPVFAQLDDLGMKALVVVYNVPAWAGDEACGPISDYDTLARFINEVVPRYQATAAAWEFINEPDGFRPHPYGPYIGCWAPYPEDYAQALQMFYAMVKGIDRDALIFFGGLAYDSWDNFDRDFLANTLDYGAGDFFDGLSFHFYPINDDEFPNVTYKLNELRTILADHGVSGKRFWITEMSMWANSDDGLTAQQDFIVKELTRAYCAGVDNIFWFAIRQDTQYPPTLHRWLIDADHNPAQAHATYAHYNARINNGFCFGPVADLPPGAEAYRFSTKSGPVYIGWTEGEAVSLMVEATETMALLDREGGLITNVAPESGEAPMTLTTTPSFFVIAE